MVFLMPIPPKPPWHSTPTATEPLPIAVPNCKSYDNIENKSNDDIENDRPSPDDDNDNDDVDCFPDKTSSL